MLSDAEAWYRWVYDNGVKTAIVHHWHGHDLALLLARLHLTSVQVEIGPLIKWHLISDIVAWSSRSFFAASSSTSITSRSPPSFCLPTDVPWVIQRGRNGSSLITDLNNSKINKFSACNAQDNTKGRKLAVYLFRVCSVMWHSGNLLMRSWREWFLQCNVCN